MVFLPTLFLSFQVAALPSHSDFENFRSRAGCTPTTGFSNGTNTNATNHAPDNVTDIFPNPVPKPSGGNYRSMAYFVNWVCLLLQPIHLLGPFFQPTNR